MGICNGSICALFPVCRPLMAESTEMESGEQAVALGLTSHSAAFIRTPSVLAQPIVDKRKECLGSIFLLPRIVSAMLQLPILQLRKIRSRAIPDQTAGMRIIIAVDHQDRNLDISESRRIDAFHLQPDHIVPRFLLRFCIDLFVLVR